MKQLLDRLDLSQAVEQDRSDWKKTLADQHSSELWVLDKLEAF
jgi:hypothetical protein